MYEGNNEIDKPKPEEWSPIDVERLFIFCLFDRAMPYEKVCKSYEFFDKQGLLDFDKICKSGYESLIFTCKASGLRFYRETARYLFENATMHNGDSLMKMTRDELVQKCPGIGYKLASMFCNRIHKTQYAIIDVHIDRFLAAHGCVAKTYLSKEKDFIEIARGMNMTPDELDWKIWNENRIGNRKK